MSEPEEYEARVRVFCNDQTRNFHRKHGRSTLAAFRRIDPSFLPGTPMEHMEVLWLPGRHARKRTYSATEIPLWASRALTLAAQERVFFEMARMEGTIESREKAQLRRTSSQGQYLDGLNKAIDEVVDRYPERVAEVGWDLAANATTPRGPRFSLEVLSEQTRFWPDVDEKITEVGTDGCLIGWDIRCPCARPDIPTMNVEPVSLALEKLSNSGLTEVSVDGLMYAIEQVKH